MSSSIIKITAIIFKKPGDWDRWIVIIESMIIRGQVEAYIDLTAEIEISEPIKFQIFQSEDLDEAPTFFSMTEIQIKMLMILKDDHRQALRVYERKRTALKEIDHHILTTVDSQFVMLLKGKTTVQSKLLILKQRLASTDRIRKLEMNRRYKDLLMFFKYQQIDKGLMDGEIVYVETKKLNISIIQDDAPLYDFLNSLRSVDISFVSSKKAVIKNKIKSGLQFSTLKNLLEDYRNHVRTARALIIKNSFNSAFAILNEQSDQSDQKKKNRDCLCGERHEFSKCLYLMIGLKTSDGTSDQKIEHLITEKMANFPTLKAAVDRARKFHKKKLNKTKKKSEKKPEKKPDQPIGSSAEAFLVKNVAFQPIRRSAEAFSVSSAYSAENFIYKLKNCWTLDSESDIHICNNQSRFSYQRPVNESDALVSKKTIYAIEAYESIDIGAKEENESVLIRLLDVALAPGFMTNLVCLRKFINQKMHGDTENSRLHQKEETFCYTPSVDDHGVLKYNPPNSESGSHEAFASSIEPPPVFKTTTMKGHEMLGHPGPEIINHLKKAIDKIKMTKTDSYPINCEICSLTKTKKIISRRTGHEEEALISMKRVEYDLIQMTEIYNDDNGVSHFIDFHIDMNFVYTHRRKNDALGAIKEFLNTIENRYKAAVRFIRINDEQILKNQYAQLMQSKNIITERTTSYTPDQNGMTERSGEVLIIRAKAIRITIRLSANLWPEAFKAASYLNNRTPRKRIYGKTLMKVLIDEKLRLFHLHSYDCRTYPLKYKILKKQKLEPRAFIDYLMEYDSTNIFRIGILSRMKIIRTRDVTFDHTRFYDPNEIDLGHLLSISIEETIEILSIPETAQSENVLKDVLEENTLTNQLILSTNDSVESTMMDDFHTSMKTVDKEIPPHLLTPEETPEREISKITDERVESPEKGKNVEISSKLVPLTEPEDVPLNRSRKQRALKTREEMPADSVAMNTRFRKQAYASILITSLNLEPYFAAFFVELDHSESDFQHQHERFHRDTLPSEPKHWRQMLKHQFVREFEQATIKKISELKKRGTYRLIEKKSDQAMISLTGVFKYKFDINGYFNKFKTRLCVKKNLQSTEKDTYAATLAAKTFRAIMALAAAFDLKIYQYDAVNAFINSILNEEIYCQPSDEFVQKEQCGKLLKILYDLKQTPMLGYKELSSTLKNLGVSSIPDVNCLYANEWLIVFFYVNDIVVLCTKQNIDKLLKFETALLKRFEMRSLKELKGFLGIRINRNRNQRKIWLCQDSYISKIAVKFNLHGIKEVKTSMLVGGIPRANENQEIQENKQLVYAYQQRVGSLNFASVITRPDISFATSRLSQFLQNLTPDHLIAVDRVISYLYSTKNLAIEYSGQPATNVFLCSNDVAFADDELIKRSSDGYLFQLYEGAIDWRATKQSTMITSSTETELLTLTRTAKEAMGGRRFFESVRFDINQKLMIRCDNRQTIRILKKESFKLNTKLRHIDIHRHWLRQKMQAERIDIDWISIAEMSADGLIKHLSRQKHEEFVRQLNLVDITDQITMKQT